MDVSEKLKAIRAKLGLSQRGLSYKIKLSRGYIGNLESGVRNPSTRVREKINYFYSKYCCTPEPLVEVMTPKKPKQSWFVRLIKWIVE